MTTPLFPASVVGSLPRPQFVRDLLERRGPEDDVAMDRAVAYAIAMQERAGLDVVTDGEWRRHSYIGVIAELAHGFARGVNPIDGRPWTTVVDRLASSSPGFIAREASFVRKLTTRQVKITLPAPALLGERLWDPVRSRKAYPDRDDFVRDCVPILRREIELIAASGADIVQIDDPHLCLFVDPKVRAQYDDPERAAAFAVDMVNAVVAGFPTLNFAVHLCRRAGARVRGEKQHEGGFERILPHLNALKVRHLTMEFTSAGAGDAAVLRGLREDFEIGLGCVSVTPGEVDTPETIVARVEQAMQHTDKSRITLNPDCGFAPGSAARVDIDEVYAKLCNEVAAARTLRDRHR
ncbi:MAG: cobalamin-independent methionine synthase II family protein [Alphaproteobacteria bacterium]|nr:cobalamin-independent methionine synthase II family protein [Alphaproteobacteria bacterium]